MMLKGTLQTDGLKAIESTMLENKFVEGNFI